MPNNKSPEKKPLPNVIIDFITAFIRALNTARLYTGGHDLLKKHTQQLYTKLDEAMADHDFLFLGCAKDTFFLEGTFYQVKDAHPQKFLKFFHSLGISHLLLEKEITAEELESFIVLLAGAKQGQGNEVSSALPRENIQHVRLGLMDYTIFSTFQTVATHLAQTSKDETIWLQLILHPVAAGAFNLNPEQIKQLTLLSEDMDEFKKLLLRMNGDMAERQQGVSVTNRAVLLSYFIQNIGNIIAGIDPQKRSQFDQHVGAVLDSLDPQLKIQILGAVPPDVTREEERSVVHEIFQAMTDTQIVYLLVDTLKEAGANSPYFSNLFNRALAKYKDPGQLLTLIRQEMHRATLEGESGALRHWQYLEQLLFMHQETRELNEQYRKEIEVLATSIHMKVSMVEEEEMSRLLKTLNPEPLKAAKAQLIIDLINQLHTTRAKAFLPSLIENLGEILDYFFSQSDFLTVGNLLREAFLALGGYPQDVSVKRALDSLFNAEDIRELLKNLLEQCRTYEPKETIAIDAICQLYREKAGEFLLDILVDLKDDDSLQTRWLSTTLVSLGPVLTRILSRRLQGAPDPALPRILTLATVLADKNLVSAVEQLLDHRSHEIRLKVISTLGRLQAERVVPRLSEIVLQRSWVITKKRKSLQMTAARALAEIASDRARGILNQVATSKRSSDLRTLCQELL